MATVDKGFLAGLGVSDIDKRMESQGFGGGPSKFQRSFEFWERQGRKSAPLFGGLIGGIQGLFGGEDKEGFKAGFERGARKVAEGNQARQLGISGDELRKTKEFNQQIASINFDTNGDFDSQIANLRKIISVANRIGMPEVVQNGMAQLVQLERDKQEFNRLQAEETRAAEREKRQITSDNLEHAEDQVWDGWNPDTGVPVAGVVVDSEGNPVAQSGGTPVGVLDGEGKLLLFGKDFVFEDPIRRDDSNSEGLDERFRKVTKSGEKERVAKLVIDGLEAGRKYDRVMDTLVQLHDEGRAQSVAGGSGTVLTVLDNLEKNIKGVAKSFLIPSKDERANPSDDWMGMRNWRKKAEDADDPVWDLVSLPPGVARDSADAQNYRAQILELAYMAARIAEPSNRGLSDRDIESALKRIAGDSSNPQLILRRFIEMMWDGSKRVEDELAVYRYSFPPFSPADVEQFIAGDRVQKYRDEMRRLYKKYGVTFTDAGRANFQRQIDSDTNPPSVFNQGGASQTVRDETDEERRNRILGK